MTFGKTAPTPENLSPPMNFYNKDRSSFGAQDGQEGESSPNHAQTGATSVYSGGGNMLNQISSSLSPDDELRHARLQGSSDDYGGSPPYNKFMTTHNVDYPYQNMGNSGQGQV